MKGESEKSERRRDLKLPERRGRVGNQEEEEEAASSTLISLVG